MLKSFKQKENDTTWKQIYQKGIQGIRNGKCMGKDRFIESNIMENGVESFKGWFLH